MTARRSSRRAARRVFVSRSPEATRGMPWSSEGTARLVPAKGQADATITAEAQAWRAIAQDVRGGLDAYRSGRLTVRRNLHLGVGFLAATSGLTGSRATALSDGRHSRCPAVDPGGRERPDGAGSSRARRHQGIIPPDRCRAGPRFRVIAVDLPGFGDSDKPIGASYDARFFARAVVDLLDALELDRVHLIGNSLGGRVALEVGLLHPDRVDRLALLCPSLAWRRQRPWAPLLRLTRPELGLVQLSPRPVVEAIVRRLIPDADGGWTAAGVDEFLRAYLTPAGRAAFYAAARQIYLEEPHGKSGFWPRLRGLESRCAVRLGSARPARPDRLRAARRRRAAACSSRRARMRTRASDRAAPPDPRSGWRVSGRVGWIVDRGDGERCP